MNRIEELAAKLSAAIGEPVSTDRPEDSITVAEYAEQCVLSHEGARYRLRKLEKRGVVECIRVKNVLYFRFK